MNSGLFRRFKNISKNFSKVVIFSLVFFSAFLIYTNKSFAQSSPYPNYSDLFSGASPKSSLLKLQFVDQGTKDVNLKFNLQTSFNLDLFVPEFGDDNVKKKDAAWGHIGDAEIPAQPGNPLSTQYYSKKLFILRICDVTETKCYFSPLPYSRKPEGGVLTPAQ